MRAFLLLTFAALGLCLGAGAPAAEPVGKPRPADRQAIAACLTAVAANFAAKAQAPPEAPGGDARLAAAALAVPLSAESCIGAVAKSCIDDEGASSSAD